MSPAIGNTHNHIAQLYAAQVHVDPVATYFTSLEAIADKIEAIPANYIGYVDSFRLPVFVTQTDFFIFMYGQWVKFDTLEYAVRALA